MNWGEHINTNTLKLDDALKVASDWLIYQVNVAGSITDEQILTYDGNVLGAR